MSTTAIPLADRPHIVYRCYSHGGGLLYVGCALNLSPRLVDHRGKVWWRACGSITVQHFDNRAAALAAEAQAIRTEFPAHNLMGTGAGLSVLGADPPIRDHVAYVPRHAAVSA